MRALAQKAFRHQSGLQLFDPSTLDRSGSPGRITLREAYCAFLEPTLGDRAPATRSQLLCTIGEWERLTSNPPIDQISDMTLVKFRDDRRNDEGGIAEATVNKDLRGLRRIMRRIGPRCDGNPGGQGLISLVPYCEMLVPGEPRKRIASANELSALYEACDVATWPNRCGISPPLLWRATIVCLLNWGLNTQDLFRLDESSIVPGDGRRGLSRPDRLYLRFVRRKTQRHKPAPIILPLNETVQRHVASIRRPGGRLFPFPRNTRDIKRQWDVIHAEAGIALESKIHFQDLRKTCNTYFDMVSPGIGEWILGHAPREVNAKFYLDVEKRILAAVDQFPQPAGFSRFERQLRLF